MLDEQERAETNWLFSGLEPNGVARESDEREHFHWAISFVFLQFDLLKKKKGKKWKTIHKKISHLGCWLPASSEGVDCLESLLGGLLLSLLPPQEPSKAS